MDARGPLFLRASDAQDQVTPKESTSWKPGRSRYRAVPLFCGSALARQLARTRAGPRSAVAVRSGGSRGRFVRLASVSSRGDSPARCPCAGAFLLGYGCPWRTRPLMPSEPRQMTYAIKKNNPHDHLKPPKGARSFSSGRPVASIRIVHRRSCPLRD